MNRRKFISSIVILTGGTLVAYYSSKYLKIIDVPDISYLDQNKNLIADLAEVIIPKTETPGAKEAQVHEYIIHMIKQEKDVKIQNNFINGLKDLNQLSREEHGGDFSQLNWDKQILVLSHFHQDNNNFNGTIGKVKNMLLGKSFFQILKELTCIGYCTSKLGATQGLTYDPIPGKYISTIQISSSQKAWATK